MQLIECFEVLECDVRSPAAKSVKDPSVLRGKKESDIHAAALGNIPPVYH